MKTIHSQLNFYCGDSWVITGVLDDDDDHPLDLTGASIDWKLSSYDGLTDVISLSLGSGITVVDGPTATVKIEAPPEQTITILPDTYIDSITVTLANNQVFTEWVGVIIADRKP